MSNNNTVPSAEEVINDCFEKFDPKELKQALIRNVSGMLRLRLEAMRDSFCKEEYLDVDRNNIREAVNTYIKNNKL